MPSSIVPVGVYDTIHNCKIAGVTTDTFAVTVRAILLAYLQPIKMSVHLRGLTNLKIRE
jgi:hypothetical protein